MPQANPQTSKVSVTTVKSTQRKRAGEKGSCVSHMKIYACCKEMLKGCCALEWGQVAGAGGAFCWVLLFHQGRIRLNSNSVSLEPPPFACAGECAEHLWWTQLHQACSFFFHLEQPPWAFEWHLRRWDVFLYEGVALCFIEKSISHQLEWMACGQLGRLWQLQ